MNINFEHQGPSESMPVPDQSMPSITNQKFKKNRQMQQFQNNEQWVEDPRVKTKPMKGVKIQNLIKNESISQINSTTIANTILEGGGSTQNSQVAQDTRGAASGAPRPAGNNAPVFSGRMSAQNRPRATDQPQQTRGLYGERGALGSQSLPTSQANLPKVKSLHSNLIPQGQNQVSAQKIVNSSSSLGIADPLKAVGASKTAKRNYLYCVDTRQIIAMLEYAITMISVPNKVINQQIETLEKQRIITFERENDRKKIFSDLNVKGHRSKSSQDFNGNTLQTKKNMLKDACLVKVPDDQAELSLSQQNEIRTELFCSGNKEMIGLAAYLNQKLQTTSTVSSVSSQTKNQQRGLFKQSVVSSKQDAASKQIDFARIFSLDHNAQVNSQKFELWQAQNQFSYGSVIDSASMTQKFLYFVENEKILSKKMFYIDVQRDNFHKMLKEIKTLLQSFIQRKYKNCITKIGFSSQQEIYNIFNKMFNSKKGFFNSLYVRKVLNCFWSSIREIFTAIRLKNFSDHPDKMLNPISKISDVDEAALENNFYMRLEFLARGRQIYEPFLIEEHMHTLHSSMISNASVAIQNSLENSLDKISSGNLAINENSFAKLFPLHQAIFDSNLRHLSKILKQEIEGTFYINKNCLDPCGNTPLMLAVKLGNIDAVKILSDVYTCPKLRPLPDLMNAKEIAIAMKHPPILKILISSNQKLKQQFFEDNKQAIFKVLESIPDFKVDLNMKCDSNLFPVFSSVAPSDTYKIYKQGSDLRLDMTLLGIQGFNLLKGNITVLYKGRKNGEETAGDLLIIDNKAQTVNSIFNRNQENKINAEIQNILTGKMILKKYQTHSSSTQIETDRSNKPIFKNINDFECQKWTLKSRYTMMKYQMNLREIDQIKGFKNFNQYIETLEIDYSQLLQSQLQALYIERGATVTESEQSSIMNFFNRKQGQAAARDQAENAYLKRFNDQGPNTSRVNLGGTSKLDKQGSGMSSRENSGFRNLGGEVQNMQMHTQEDQLSNDNIGGIFARNRGSLQAQNNMLANNKQIIIKKSTQKQVQANLWLSKTYPFDIEQFLPLIHVLSFCSKQIRQFNKFLLKYPLPNSCFPVEARIPLLMTMEAVFSFKNLQLGFKDSSVFQMDKTVAMKQRENMAVYAKQQISLLNQHSSLDTQEDKQARALREIYKLCKTDEGESGDHYSYDNEIYRIIDEAQERQNEEDSENSDKIQNQFDQMNDDEYDVIKEELLIQENDGRQYEESKNHAHKKSRIRNKNSNVYVVEEEEDENPVQSRNFAAGKSSFHELKKSMTHSEMLKLRKSVGQQNGRTPSMQFSLQSDITESIEVSEKSFNDKLSKLQIHSFQNVKFMSQLKKNRTGSGQKQMSKILDQQLSQQAANQLMSQNRMFDVVVSRDQVHHKNQISNVSQLSGINQENIYDSKLNETRPKINKSLGKHQINNHLHLYTKNKTRFQEEEKQRNDTRPPIGVFLGNASRPKAVGQNSGYNQSNITIGTIGDTTISKDFQPRPVPKDVNYIQQPRSNIGMSVVSMGSNTMESSVNMNSIGSFSHGIGGNSILESRNLMQPAIPSSTAGSSKPQSISSAGFKQPRILDQNAKLKQIIGNLRNPQGTGNYLITIESEGNLPTQQFGGKYDNRMSKASCNNLSQRSIHSLDEAEEESSQSQKINEQSYQNFLQQNNLSAKDQQVFGYEKQHRSEKLDLSLIKDAISQGSQVQIGSMLQHTKAQMSSSVAVGNSQLKNNKLNFFQKMTNFIQESITDRKHHSNKDEALSGHGNNTDTKSLLIEELHEKRSNEDDVFTKNLDHTSGKNFQIANSRSKTMKKLKKVVSSTPKGSDKLTPLKHSSTTGRDDIKRNRGKEDSLYNKEGGQTEFQSAMDLQNALNHYKQSKPFFKISQPTEQQNSTQTYGSLPRDVNSRIRPSHLLGDSPLQEGTIQNQINQMRTTFHNTHLTK